MRRLRFLTYLSPSIPAAFFELLVDEIGRREEPALAARLRVLEAWGPLPIQPLLASAILQPGLRERVAETLLGLDATPAMRRRLWQHRVRRFAPVDSTFYDSFPILGQAAADGGVPGVA